MVTVGDPGMGAVAAVMSGEAGSVQRKRTIRSLRFLLLLAVFGAAYSTAQQQPLPWQFWLAAGLLFASNIVYHFEQTDLFQTARLGILLFLFDAGLLGYMMTVLGERSNEFFVLFALTILMAAMSRSLSGALAGTVAVGGLYTMLTLHGKTGVEFLSVAFTTRIALLFVLSIFIAQLAREAGLADVALRRAERLVSINRELEIFSASVSHDLQAPLRAIQGFSLALLEDSADNLDGPAQDAVRRIVIASKRMDVMIQELLAYARLGDTELKIETVALASVMEDVLTMHEPMLKDRKARVSVERPLPAVRGHASMLVHVLGNLLTNAVKFTASSIDPRVQVRAEVRGDAVRLWVEDNGVGIAPEDQTRIFKMFARVGAQSACPGTGIGLAIVKKGILRMGGQVGVESAPGLGSRFWVELPKG